VLSSPVKLPVALPGMFSQNVVKQTPEIVVVGHLGEIEAPYMPQVRCEFAYKHTLPIN